MNIKTVGIIFLIIALLALMEVFFYFLSTNKGAPTQQIPPIQIFSPAPSPSSPPSAASPADLERIKQENYAKTREDYLQSRPWLSKLPLQSDNYFVSYNASDVFIVELYYSENSNLTKEQQLAQAKQDALNAMGNVGIDISKQQVQYLEIAKTL